MSAPVPFLRLTGVTKRFGGAVALDAVDWDVLPGEIHCLVGENGCGKSTLIKLVAGVHACDGGRIEIAGAVVQGLTPARAKALGIHVIFQDLSLFPNLSVAENIAFDDLLHGLARPVRRRPMRAVAARLLDRLGITLDIDAAVADLSIAERQIVAICRGLAAGGAQGDGDGDGDAGTGGPGLLFMDEPTASLTRTEVDALLGLVLKLKRDGIAVVFVSHRLDEVIEIADRVTVLRDGARVGTWPARALDERRIAELMTGLDLVPPRREPPAVPVAAPVPVLEVLGLARTGEFEAIDFTLHRGEVLGLTGLLGAGRTELALTLFGMRRPEAGSLRLDGQPLRIASNRDAIRAGIAYVSEDRLRLGLNLRQPVADNLVLAILDTLTGPLGLIPAGARERVARGWVERLRIRLPGLDQPVGQLSGGNQQRVVLAKWLATGPKVLILDSPTVGVDIGNKQGIYALVAELAAAGVAILMISDEIPEVYATCDRILHMRSGRLVDSFIPGRDPETLVKERVHA